MPQNARSFWKMLLSGALKPGVLRRLRFTSFGLGDSSYPRYNVSHRMLCGRLTQLGASSFCERGEGNEQHPEGHSAGFREWIVQLKIGILDAFPLPDGVEPMGDAEFLEPKWKLALDESPNGVKASNREAKVEDGESVERSDQPSDATLQPSLQSIKIEDPPSTKPIPIKDSYSADLVANDRMTAVDHFQDVRLLDIRLDRPYTYNPGAVAVIYPKNFPSDVEEFMKLMRWEDIADTPITISPTRPIAPGQATTPSPLRHLDLSATQLTLRWLLENAIDIMSIPRRSFFANLAYFAGTSTEDEEYQKERLLELANPELIDELWDYTTRPKRTILEVMMDFTTIRIPWQYALSALPLMRGRQFSIASGGDLKYSPSSDSHGDRTRVQLLVAIADPPSPIIKYRRRHGVCTRYIATLQAGQKLTVGMQQGYLDVQPGEISQPVVLVGPGTGLAPMRAMAHQRLAWARELNVRDAGTRLQGDVLFFGCRGRAADYFFQHEWEDIFRPEAMQEYTAFSRDKNAEAQQGGGKYVQHQIRKHAGAVFEAVHEREGRIYVCGSSGNMPKAVREAFVEVLVEQGGGKMSREDAEAYLDTMEKEGRYKQETW